jgi:hypothetical protein
VAEFIMHYNIEKFIDEALAEDIIYLTGKIPACYLSSQECIP